MGASSGAPAELAKGLWSWSGRHPEWHPGDFGSEVMSFAARARDGVLHVIDPLLPLEGAEGAREVLELLDSEAERAERVAILITIGYHVRSSERLWDRWHADRPVAIHGNRTCLSRLERSSEAFEETTPGAELPGGAVAHQIGRPKRTELPLHLPDADAVVFGDAVVGVGGELRVWSTRQIDGEVESFYRERFNPTLEPLVALGTERILTTHGQSVLEGGSEALRRALRARPWYHHG